MPVELFRKYRPKRFTDVLGQPELTKTLIRMVNKKRVPRVILFYGPPGTSKTTCARILASKVGCRGTDLVELNAADFRGIDTARDIRSNIGYVPMKGGARVWIIDEAGALGKPAQNAFLKILEEVPDHVYFFLATTEPQQLIATIRSRCTELATKSLDSNTMETLLGNICKKEKVKISENVRDRIVEVADGSARKALVILHQVMDLDTDKEQLEAIYDSDSQKQAIELCRLLMKPRPQWREAAKLIEKIKDEPEKVRRIMLGYASTVALKKPNPGREILIIDRFSGHYFDAGKAGLIWSTYQCCQALGK